MIFCSLLLILTSSVVFLCIGHLISDSSVTLSAGPALLFFYGLATYFHYDLVLSASMLFSFYWPPNLILMSFSARNLDQLSVDFLSFGHLIVFSVASLEQVSCFSFCWEHNHSDLLIYAPFCVIIRWVIHLCRYCYISSWFTHKYIIIGLRPLWRR